MDAPITDVYVGRDVHYVARGSADGVFPVTCRAAKVTEVDDPKRNLVSLVVFNPTGWYLDRRMPYSRPSPADVMAGGTWHLVGECLAVGGA